MSDTPRLHLCHEAHRQALQIAVDGPASAGKSTVGSRLAVLLECPFLDTGLMYRAVTALAIAARIPAGDELALTKLVQPLRFRLSKDGQLLVDDKAVGDNVRTPEVDTYVSEVSVHVSVRNNLVGQQREMASGRCFVMAGRDIGTVVLPQAPVKLWITASATERARRRALERSAGPPEAEALKLASELRRRDEVDSTRTISPSVPATDATIIDTDGLTIDAVLQEAMTWVALALDPVPR